jgi:hypothetical protein
MAEYRRNEMKTNNAGVQIRTSEHGLVTTSAVSALSGRRLNSAAITSPLPGWPGVFVRFNPGEQQEDRSQLYARAEDFVAKEYPEFKPTLKARTPAALKKTEDSH